MRKLLFVFSIVVNSFLSVCAQSEIVVKEIVYINEEFDKVLDSLGNVHVRLNINFGQIYYHLFYISIQTNDTFFFHDETTPIFLHLMKNNDTIPFIKCDDTLRENDNDFILWFIAPLSDEDLPCEKEFIIQDIELSCNLIDSLWENAFDLLYYDNRIDKFRPLEFSNFNAPYYAEDKVKFRMLCPYPSAFDERWLKKTQILNDNSTPEFEDSSDYDNNLFEP